MSGVGLDLELEKERGNAQFANRDYHNALQHYLFVMNNHPPSLLGAVTLSNMSECYLLLGHYHDALDAAEKSLELLPPNNANKISEKALFRRAKALEGVGSLDEALQSYRVILQQYPTNAGAAAGIRALTGEDATDSGGSLGRSRTTDLHGAQMKEFSEAMMKGLEREAKRESEEEEGGEQLSTCCELVSYLWCRGGRRRGKGGKGE